MFKVEFTLLSPDPFNTSKIPYAIDVIEKELNDICSPIRAGASVLCSPSKESLIIIYTAFNETKQLNVYIRVESFDSQVLVQIVDKINKKLRQQGYVITLSRTFSSSS